MDYIFQPPIISKIGQMAKILKSVQDKAKANKNPIEFFAQYGIDLPSAMHYRIHIHDGQYFYLVIPMNNNAHISEQWLSQLHAGKTVYVSSVSSFGSASCIATASCPWFCASTLNSMDSLGTTSTYPIIEPNTPEHQ